MGLKMYAQIAGVLAVAGAILWISLTIKHWHSQSLLVPGLEAQIEVLQQDLGIVRGEVDSYSTELEKLNRIYDQLQQKHAFAVTQAQEIAAEKMKSEKALRARLEELRASIPVPGTSCEEITRWELESLPRSW